MTRAANPKVDRPAELPGSGDESTALVTAVHRADLHESGISDAVIDGGRLASLPRGIGIGWDDGVVRTVIPMFDRDKRPKGKDGKPMKAGWPSSNDGGSELGPNLLRLSPANTKTAVVEGMRQMHAALSHAPADWNVVGISGVRGVHAGNVARCTWAKGQAVVLLPDADADKNADVRAGVAATAGFLRDAGAASVAVAVTPGIPAMKEGIDDVLARTVEGKRAALLANILANAEPVTGAQDDSELFITGTDFLAAGLVDDPALWGAGDVHLWAPGESLMLVGPPGVGKSTLAHLVVFGALGLLDDAVGWPVAAREGALLYLAMDRPRQIARAMHRLVRPEHRQTLAERLIVRNGPLPVDLCEQPEWLRDHALAAGVTTVVVDSLKDVLPDPSDEKRAGLYNRARQLCLAAGIEFIELHHNRKANAANKEPNTLDDVYGSRWLTAGAGSVVSLFGQPGDVVVSMRQLRDSANRGVLVGWGRHERW